MNKVILITGVMAAGKSTLAQALAERLPNSVHLRGDVFRKMIVNGRRDMGNPPGDAALAQLRMRYRLAAGAAAGYLQAGFDVVYQDVMIGPILNEVVSLFQNLPVHLVVLCPRVETVEQREAARSKTGYGAVSVQQLQAAMQETPQLGYWLDNSDLSVDQSVDSILQHLAAARLPQPDIQQDG